MMNFVCYCTLCKPVHLIDHLEMNAVQHCEIDIIGVLFVCIWLSDVTPFSATDFDLTCPLAESLLQRILFRIQLLKDVVVGDPDKRPECDVGPVGHRQEAHKRKEGSVVIHFGDVMCCDVGR